MYIGFALMLLPISLPGFVSNTIGALSSCTIPVSMIVIGAIASGLGCLVFFYRAFTSEFPVVDLTAFTNRT